MLGNVPFSAPLFVFVVVLAGRLVRFWREVPAVLLVLAVGCGGEIRAISDGGGKEGGASGGQDGSIGPDAGGDSDEGAVATCKDPTPAPRPCGDIADAGLPVSVVSGDYFTCALFSGGTVKCWGDNMEGELGIGVSCVFGVASPLPVSNLCGVKAVSAGHAETCALTRDATVRCWGAAPSADVTTLSTLDAAPQTGPGCETIASSGRLEKVGSMPGTIPCLTEVNVVSEGCAVLEDGTVDCWGNVSSIHDAVGLAAEDEHVCAVLRDGTVECWGQNDSGELGDGTTRPSSVPVKVKNLSEPRRSL